MITKFLYQMNVVNKRIITGCVENDTDVTYDAFREIPMELENTYKLADGERKVSNFGKLYYAVFRDSDYYKYLNLNDYMLKVKIEASDKVQFATPLSKECLNSILFNTNYLDQDTSLEFIESGFTLEDNLEYDDEYRKVFKKIDDDQYVELVDYDEVCFVAKKESEKGVFYDIVDDFKDATLIYKKELRPLLFTHKYLGSKIKTSVYMSHYNIFKNFDTNEYLFAGYNSFKVLYDGTKIVFEKDPVITSKFRLVNDEERNLILREILNIIKHREPRGSFACTINDLYVARESDSVYRLTKNASEATKVSDNILDIFRNIVKLYSDLVYVKSLSLVDDAYYLYSHLNSYEITNEKRIEESKLIKKDDAINFVNVFNNFNNLGDTLLLLNSKYIKLDYANNKFTINYLDSAYNASVFTKEEVSILEKILNKKFEKRETSIIKDTTNHYNIDSDKPLNVISSYNAFLNQKAKSNIHFGNSRKPLNELKVGSDKAAFEYLEETYVRAVIDTKYVTDKLIKRVNNILVIGSTGALDLYGIALSALENNKNIHVSLLDTCKWGYYPHVSIGENVTFDGSYRLEADALNKDNINKFDCIIFSKRFNGNKEGLLDLISCLEKDNYNGYIVNISYTNKLNLESNFSSIVKEKTNFNKYLIKLNLDEYKEKFEDIALLDDVSYYSILRIKNKKLVDATKANK